ncbi:MAG: hypothetical protein OEZ06_20440 [Myxococcales bacterium]|nr:hypothetical protein [Myxococcales bacterium]
MRPKSIAAACGMLGITALITAHTYPTNQCNSSDPCEPDNNNHYWCDASSMGSNNYGVAMASFESYLDNVDQTEIRYREDPVCDSLTDVWAYHTYDLSYLGDVRGLYQCWNIKAAGSGYECESSLVKLDDTWFNSNYSTTTARRRAMQSTWCHEIGHSLGLDHWSGSSAQCMRSDATVSMLDDSSSWYREYGSHDWNHIEVNLDNVL